MCNGRAALFAGTSVCKQQIKCVNCGIKHITRYDSTRPVLEKNVILTSSKTLFILYLINKFHMYILHYLIMCEKYWQMWDQVGQTLVSVLWTQSTSPLEKELN